MIIRRLCRAPSNTKFGKYEQIRGFRKQVQISSLDDMDRLASAIAENSQPGDTLCLYGKVGAGKTAFARQFIRHRTGHPDLEVVSPTFTIDIAYDHAGSRIHHLDLHRLPVPAEGSAAQEDRAEDRAEDHLQLLGIDEMLTNGPNHTPNSVLVCFPRPVFLDLRFLHDWSPLHDATDLCLVEWPDRLGLLLPTDRLDLLINDDQACAGDNDDSEERVVELRPVGARWEQLFSKMVNGGCITMSSTESSTE